jgi:hypothetical protein
MLGNYRVAKHPVASGVVLSYKDLVIGQRHRQNLQVEKELG